MDTVAALAFARELIDIDSTTGREGEAATWLATKLRALGWNVAEQPVDGDRFNVLAAIDTPDVVLSTHFDCVPPFFPSSIREGTLYGRGSCDAKGILAAQVAAAERLRAQGARNVGMLFVVGEERGSDGAAAANRSAPGSKFLVNGEPTDSQIATGTRGILRVRLKAQGRAGHSSAPELFESAIEKLIDALVRLRQVALPEDVIFGKTSYSIGLIDGGVAPNVVPANASAEVMFRTVGDADEVLAAAKTLEPLIAVEEVLRVPPVKLTTIPGMPSRSFPFTTDIPLLDKWGAPLLYGPGSFLVAHTDDEHLTIAEFDAAIDGYVSIVQALMPSQK
jgi:acetylornithine deacetylase